MEKAERGGGKFLIDMDTSPRFGENKCNCLCKVSFIRKVPRSGGVIVVE